jgi:RNA polymerase sigma-70 factor (ECF subfamily)
MAEQRWAVPASAPPGSETPIEEATMRRAPAVRARPAAAAEMTGAARGEAHRTLAALYADHGGALLRYAMHLTGGDRHRAEDVVQKTMLGACQRPWPVAGPPVRAWLFTVARHWAIDQHRAQQARPAEVAAMADLTARAAPDKIDAAITRWDLAAAMAGLRPRDRCLLTAYYLHDDSITKIASECCDRRAPRLSVRAER